MLLHYIASRPGQGLAHLPPPPVSLQRSAGPWLTMSSGGDFSTSQDHSLSSCLCGNKRCLPPFLPMTALCSFWHICVHALAALSPSLALTHVERFQGPSLVYCIISSVSATALSQEAGDDGVSLVEAPPAEGTWRCHAQPGLGGQESVLRGGGSLPKKPS